MKQRELQGAVFGSASDTPRILEELNVGTQTIDLNTLFTRDVTSSGSFNMRGVYKSSFGKLLEALPIPAMLLDASHAVFFANQACGKFTEKNQELLGLPLVRSLLRQQDVEAFQLRLQRLSIERKPQVTEAVLGTADRKIWARIHLRSLRLVEERFVLVLVEDLSAEKRQVFLTKKYSQNLRKARDLLEEKVRERTASLSEANRALKREIAVRKLAEESLYLAARVIASSNEAIIVTDPQGIIVEVNEAFCEITGYSRAEVIGQNPRIMASGRHEKAFWEKFWQTLIETGQWRGEVWDRRKNGEIFPKLLSVRALKEDTGEVTHYVGIFSDISKLKESEERLDHLAHFDPLTSLPNRLLFQERLNRALIQAERDAKKVAVLFLDLDSFKHVNDTFGHPVGDDLLVSVAERLSTCVRKGDTVARLGGDEFIIVMPDVNEVTQIAMLAERLIEVLSKPFEIRGNEIFTSGSIGISVYPADGTNVHQLLQHADTAMYHAKAQGKNSFQFFSAEMNLAIKELVRMETMLRQAMEYNRLQVYHQPIIHCRKKEIIGTEALLRLNVKGEKDLTSGGPFIRIAEERGLITSIGEWVLRRACENNRKWQEMGFREIPVAINMSMHQLRHRDVVEGVLRVLAETGQDPRFVELELTESAMMANPRLTISILEELKSHGLRISVDDFGTGYSSLSYLKRLPVDKIKIDKSFVDDIHTDRSQYAVIEAIIKVAHSLDMTVVAEGVESVRQMETLCDLECDAVQGFYFSPPVPVEEMTELLRRGSVPERPVSPSESLPTFQERNVIPSRKQSWLRRWFSRFS